MDLAWEDPDKNLSRAGEMISKAAAQGARLICLPELFPTGVTDKPQKYAEEPAGRTNRFLSEAAKKNNAHIVGSYIENNKKGLPMNSLAVYDPAGKPVCRYSKNHVFTFGNEDKSYSNGSGIASFQIEELSFYPFICYDLRFPEIFRAAVDKGANVFIISANWPNPRKDHWVTLLKARAIENQSYVIGINRAGSSPGLTFFGSSMIVSPKGEVISHAGENEEIIFADLDNREIDIWREKFTALKDRRIEYYNSL